MRGVSRDCVVLISCDNMEVICTSHLNLWASPVIVNILSWRRFDASSVEGEGRRESWGTGTMRGAVERWRGGERSQRIGKEVGKKEK